ncbi:MAG: terminase large subunit, partial [Comamonadaceae bacterium]
MGKRGPGAGRLKAAREALPKRKVRLPWERKGLSRAERVIAFLQFLPITKGPLAGRKMKLLPEQRAFVEAIYGNLRADGTRRRRIGIKSEPKGNGKTGLCAGLALCHLIGPEA